MWTNSKNRLATQVAILLSAVATIIITISGCIIYSKTYHQTQSNSHRALQQLIKTVSASANIAAYVNDEVLAKEVVTGLMNNDLVNATQIRSGESVLASEGYLTQSLDSKGIEGGIEYNLVSPFDKKRVIGKLTVRANQSLITSQARQQATSLVILVALSSLILISSVLLLLHFRFINAIKSIANGLHSIIPGSEQRISIKNKDNNELAVLVNDINNLLHSVEKQVKHEKELRIEVENLEKRFRDIFEKTNNGLALVTGEGFIQMHNPSFENILGKANIANLTQSPTTSLFTTLNIPRQTILRVSPENSQSVEIKLTIDEQEKWINCSISSISEEDEQYSYQVIVQDISERRLREDLLKVQAEKDHLTGVLNRRGGQLKVSQLINEAEETNTQLAILMLDLDNFKPINDSLGHEAGDYVLVSLALRITSMVRVEDLVIRWGGDEFLIVIKHSNVKQLAEKLLSTIRQPIEITDQQIVNVSASIGIALYPEHGDTLSALCQKADEAMYQVKHGTKNSFATFDKNSNTKETFSYES
jgi:diguanylate cyclase (GGDEF)-like protein/PAS domain S-box-containing protein